MDRTCAGRRGQQIARSCVTVVDSVSSARRTIETVRKADHGHDNLAVHGRCCIWTSATGGSTRGRAPGRGWRRPVRPGCSWCSHGHAAARGGAGGELPSPSPRGLCARFKRAICMCGGLPIRAARAVCSGPGLTHMEARASTLRSRADGCSRLELGSFCVKFEHVWRASTVAAPGVPRGVS